MRTFLQSPYFDDYDENKKFYSSLFRPSYPVQARELNQLNSMLQKQIERLGNHMFKEGAKVLEGQMSFDTDVSYVKLQPGFITNIDNLVGTTLTGSLSKVKGTVVAVAHAEHDDPATLFVKFIASDSNTSNQTWQGGESFVEYSDIYVLDNLFNIGTGSIATIQRGVYYVKSYFVLVDKQTIVLDKYSNVPSYRVGLKIKETIVTPESDETLLDNAQGSYNYAAPGAHRYKIELILDKVNLSNKVDSESFIELGQIQGGRVVKQVTKTEYSDLERTLARRTYDESGDYTVKPFKISVREHRNNDRGQWKANTTYLVGDIVRNYGNSYVARTSGISQQGSGPVHEVGIASTTVNEIKWEYVKKPQFNNGVYPAEGSITHIEILDGGKGYVTPPDVNFISSDGSGAQATAVISEGKVIDVIIDNHGYGFTAEKIAINFVGGLASDSDQYVAKDKCAAATAFAYTDVGDDEKLAVGFEGGKAYVQGFEIEKLGTSWVAVDKARETEQANDVLLTPNVGNYLLVTNLKGIPQPGTQLELHSVIVNDGQKDNPEDNTIVGTCRVRGFEWDSGDFTNDGGLYKLFVYDTDIKPSKSLYKHVKSVKIKGDDSFAADIATQSTLLTGGIRITGSEIKGTGTTFETELDPGDYIRVVAGNKEYDICVSSISGQNDLTTSSKQLPNTGDEFVAFYLQTANLYDPQGVSAIYHLPHQCITDTNVGDVDYRITEVIKSTSSDEGEVVFRTRSNDAEFASFQDNDNYLLFDKDGNVITGYGYPQSVETTRTITLTGVPKNQQLTLFATLCKTGNNVGLGVKKLEKGVTKFTTETSVKNSTLMLTDVDIYSIDSVLMCPDLSCGDSVDFDSSTNAIDITDRYQFFDGQTDSYYGRGYLVLKGSYSAPEYPVIVNYTYFAREVVGDYYSVQSYKDACAYDKIPSYNGTRLSDVLDFRPDLKDGFEPSRKSMLKRGTEIELSYRYYLGRKDRICLDYNGNFVNVKGISSLNPKMAELPALTMNVANIEVKPYTYSSTANDVVVDIIDHRRYTMRDIGRLENRINNLEQYTTLSLLETQTESLLIRDSEGYDRFKQGFAVDNFKSNLLLSSNDDNVHCSIDVENGVCRPPFVSHHISLFEHFANSKAMAKQQRVNSNYRLYGKVYTLPLDPYQPHVAIVEQPLATRIENVNPFAVVTYIGSMTINPASDDWFDTNYIPDVVNHIEGNYLSTKNKLEGTKWNDWQISWTGAKVTTGSSSSSTTKTTTSRGNRVENGSHDYRYDTTTKTTTTTTRTTYAQQQGQTRTGIKTVVTATTDYEVVGDRIVSTTSIPYMRSRWLLVRAKNLKPFATYTPKFDGVDVDYWCVPAAEVQLEPGSVVGSFDYTSHAGVDSTNAARRIDTTKYSYWREETDRTCLDIGDVVTDKKYTAIVVGASKTPYKGSVPEYKGRLADTLYVVNIKEVGGKPAQGVHYDGDQVIEGATFEVGSEINATNSISGAKGIVAYSESNRNHVVDPLIANSAGELNFMFWIPDGDKVDYGISTNDSPVFQFRCGDRLLSLHESEANGVASTSSAEATYSAVGIINNHERTVNAVRNAVVTTSNVTDNRTVTKTGTDVNITTSSSSSRKYVYLDPLAQTFIIGDSVKGGCFLSKIDLFFATKPTDDNPLPVTVQIRTVENGMPTGKVLPFASVTLRPDQVNLSKNTIEYVDQNGDIVSTNKYDTATTFEFESPVYVEDTAEYAIVVLSDSTDYNLWIAQIGDVVPGQNTLVSKQPHTGVLFKSQNASTWTPVQNQDLKFTLYRANFMVSDKTTNAQVVGNIKFASQPSQLQYLDNNSFQTVAGSSLVRVWQRNHGLLANMKVKFEYVDINDVDNTSLLTGTITTSTKVVSVNGQNTRFRNELTEGDILYKEDGKTALGEISKIINDRELELTQPASEDVKQGNYTIAQQVESVNGISYDHLTSSIWTVKSAEIDSYIIEVGEQATSSGYSGGSNFMTTPVINYDVIHPSIVYQSFSDTTLQCSLETVTGTSSRSTTQNEVNVVGVVDNDNNVLLEPMAIYDQYNRDYTTKQPSIVLNVSFTSTNSCLSPIIDSERLGAILINNLIDKPDHLEVNNSELDDQIVTNSDVFHIDRETGELVSNDASFNNLSIGKIIKLNNVVDEDGVVVEIGDVLITDIVNNDGTIRVQTNKQGQLKKHVVREETAVGKNDGTQLVLSTLYTDECAPLGGTAHAKYITKPISLSNTCTYLRVMFAGCVPNTSDIEVYYKAYQAGGTYQYEDVKWTKLDSNEKQPFKKVEIGSEVFTDVMFVKENLPSFDVVAVKIVFLGENSSAVPMIKDLRVIACA